MVGTSQKEGCEFDSPAFPDGVCMLLCGCLASALIQTKAMKISMTDNTERNEDQRFLVFLCGCYNPVSKSAWVRLQQPTAYFHLLACVMKLMHICGCVLHICCCCSCEFIVKRKNLLVLLNNQSLDRVYNQWLSWNSKCVNSSSPESL